MQVIEEHYTWNGSLALRSRTEYIVLHHAAVSKCTAQDVHKWHLANGWAGIGYHFFVAKNGAIYRGRPLNVIGAHAYDYNHLSVGICAEGDYEKEQMPAVQLQTLVELVACLKGIYPGAKVVGHGDLMATNCPGKNYPLEEIKMDRNEVTVLVKGRKITGKLIDGTTWTPLREVVNAMAYEVDWDEKTKTARVE